MSRQKKSIVDERLILWFIENRRRTGLGFYKGAKNQPTELFPFESDTMYRVVKRLKKAGIVDCKALPDSKKKFEWGLKATRRKDGSVTYKPTIALANFYMENRLEAESTDLGGSGTEIYSHRIVVSYPIDSIPEGFEWDDIKTPVNGTVKKIKTVELAFLKEDPNHKITIMSHNDKTLQAYLGSFKFKGRENIRGHVSWVKGDLCHLVRAYLQGTYGMKLGLPKPYRFEMGTKDPTLKDIVKTGYWPIDENVHIDFTPPNPDGSPNVETDSDHPEELEKNIKRIEGQEKMNANMDTLILKLDGVAVNQGSGFLNVTNAITHSTEVQHRSQDIQQRSMEILERIEAKLDSDSRPAREKRTSLNQVFLRFERIKAERELERWVENDYV